jgi:CBS domain-containing protein
MDQRLDQVLMVHSGNGRAQEWRLQSKKQVRDLMSHPVRTLERNDILSNADSVMHNERIRHLPVLDEAGRLVGIISQRDLFLNALVRALGYGTMARDRSFRSIAVKEVMTEDVVTTTPETPITAAAQMMVDRKIGCLPVVESNTLVGILSESDIVSAVARGDL